MKVIPNKIFTLDEGTRIDKNKDSIYCENCAKSMSVEVMREINLRNSFVYNTSYIYPSDTLTLIPTLTTPITPTQTFTSPTSFTTTPSAPFVSFYDSFNSTNYNLLSELGQKDFQTLKYYCRDCGSESTYEYTSSYSYGKFGFYMCEKCFYNYCCDILCPNLGEFVCTSCQSTFCSHHWNSHRYEAREFINCGLQMCGKKRVTYHDGMIE